MDFIPFPLTHGYKYVLVMVCMFSHWTEAFLCRYGLFFVAKILLEKIILTWRTFDQGTYFSGQFFDRSVLFVQFYSTMNMFYPQSSGLVECTDDIIKIQVAKSAETLTMP